MEEVMNDQTITNPNQLVVPALPGSRGGLTKREHFAVELTKAFIIAGGDVYESAIKGRKTADALLDELAKAQ